MACQPCLPPPQPVSRVRAPPRILSMHVPSLTFESVHISGAVIWLSHQAFLRERRRTVRCRRASRAENALKVTPLVTHHSDHRAARDIVVGRAERMLSYRIVLSRVVSCPVVFYVYCICIVCALYRVVCTVQHACGMAMASQWRPGRWHTKGRRCIEGACRGEVHRRGMQGGGGALHSR